MMVQEADIETLPAPRLYPPGHRLPGNNPLPVTILPGRVGRVSGIRWIYAANVLDLPGNVQQCITGSSRSRDRDRRTGRQLGIHRENAPLPSAFPCRFPAIPRVTRDHGTVRLTRTTGDTVIPNSVCSAISVLMAAGIPLLASKPARGIAQSEIACTALGIHVTDRALGRAAV